MQGHEQERSEWMVAWVTNAPQEAQIVAGKLQFEGIQTLLHRQAGASAMGIHIGQLGEVRVLVHPSDYEFALAILNPGNPPSLPPDGSNIIFEDKNNE
ncbi:MAG: DUF2007 domain-containing protein [Anaerolineaceae bacterium]|nr:DUF2007 domain-containing protein [Anaerolineaceae bacterium]MCY4022461.1 DUF2007 domain-containing protein [Anaerolineaceae bacterium]